MLLYCDRSFISKVGFVWVFLLLCCIKYLYIQVNFLLLLPSNQTKNSCFHSHSGGSNIGHLPNTQSAYCLEKIIERRQKPI